MKTVRKIRSSMAASIIGSIILSLVIFGIIVCTFGFVSFSRAIKKEYSTTTWHMADTAAAQINGNHIDAYLEGKEKVEYTETLIAMDEYCHRMNVSLIYIIKVDTEDYGRFVNVLNVVDNSVDNSEYTPWELGFRRNTTNEEYARKYRKLYEKEALYETVYRYKTTDGQHPHITTLVPVKSSSGNVTAILCMQRPISELREAVRPYLINVCVTAVLLAFISAAAVTIFVRKQFVTPIRKVSAESSRFAKTQAKGEPLGQISRYTEIANLADSIDKMESEMVSYMDNLAAVTAEKERIGAELSFARTIQANSVPNDFPAFPERRDFGIYASMSPAKEVGGDLYNFFLIDDDHLALMIGDVSGKGVPAALFMMVTNIVMSNRIKMGGTPAEILTFVNENICEHNNADMFITIWLGILELSTGRLTAANAGHEDPALCRKGGVFELAKTKHGLVAGAMEGARYRDAEMHLKAGDKIFIYTDGLPEATDAENRMFTLGRLLGTLNMFREESPEEILNGIHREVDAFVGDAPQFDDLTMLCLEYKGTLSR